MTKDEQAHNAGAQGGIVKTVADLTGLLQCEETRREFWKSCVLASLKSGASGHTASVYADDALAELIKRDEDFQGIDYRDTARRIDLYPPKEAAEIQDQYNRLIDEFVKIKKEDGQ